MPQHANHIGQRIRRIDDDKDQRLRLHCAQLWDDVLVDLDIRVEKPQPARRVIAVGRDPGPFNERGALGIRLEPVAAIVRQ